MVERKDELKSLLMQVKEESENVGLKFNIQKTNKASCPITSWQIDGETVEIVADLFFGSPKSLHMMIAAMKLKDTPWKESYDQSRQCITKQRHYFANKGPSSPGYGFSSSHVSMWELHYKDPWALKNWSFWTVVLEKTLEGPLGCKEIQQVHPKGDQSWVFIGRTDVEGETPIFRPPDVKNWLIWKYPERLKAGGEGDNGGWDGWMASLTQWTWVWVNSRSWWWTGRPGVLQFMGSQRVGHDWTTELNWTESLD